MGQHDLNININLEAERTCAPEVYAVAEGLDRTGRECSSVALQAAIDDNPGAVVGLPAGEYLVGDLTLGRPGAAVGLVGAASSSVMLRVKDGETAVTAYSEPVNRVIDPQDAYPIGQGTTISGVHFQGNRQGESAGVVWAGWCDWVKMNDVLFTDLDSGMRIGAPGDNNTQGFMRESDFGDVRFYHCGLAGSAALEIAQHHPESNPNPTPTNNLSFVGLDVIYSRGPGLLINNVHERAIQHLFFHDLMLHGSWQPGIEHSSHDVMAIQGRVRDVQIGGCRMNGSVPLRAVLAIREDSSGRKPGNIQIQTEVHGSAGGHGIVVEQVEGLQLQATINGNYDGDHLVFDEHSLVGNSRAHVDLNSRTNTATTNIHSSVAKRVSGWVLGEWWEPETVVKAADR